MEEPSAARVLELERFEWVFEGPFQVLDGRGNAGVDVRTLSSEKGDSTTTLSER